MRCALVPVNGKHIKVVAKAMRQRDVAEIWASSRNTPRKALEDGVASSVLCWTGMVGDKPACILGVSPASLLSGRGVPWMLATDRLARAERPMLRLSRPLIEAMQDIFPRELFNHVDARNTDTVRWLRSLGFTVEDAKPYGPDGLPFHRFSRSRCHV